ncbi:MAG: hypothetical protein CMJ38_06445 [Phycisphaerae bacterium]|nr:hypothetical protein [Phycisphaerae bacterium]
MISFSLALLSSANAELVFSSIPNNAPDGFSEVFSKHVDVLGLHVYAKQHVPNSRVLHCANILAQWIDNNEDGEVDNVFVYQELVNRHASMVMWWNEDQAEDDFDNIPNDVLDNYALQAIFGDEVNMNYPKNQEFDATLEETLHLVTHEGYSRVFPSTWGEFPETAMTNTMDAVIKGGWYHYDDPTCDYECDATEYFYWSLTSILGAQDYPWRIWEIADEWELPTLALMQKHNQQMVDLLQDSQWGLATVLPDGSYEPTLACPADFNGTGFVDVIDLLFLIDNWGQAGEGDLNGSGTVDVGDVLALIDSWGECPI